MKQFIYDSSAIGLPEWPSGTLRLEGIEVTQDPNEADIFTVPGSLTGLFSTPADLQKLPYFTGNEAKHVLFDCSDNEQLYGQSCMFIRCNTRDWFFQHDPNTISWPWPVEDYRECVELPEGGFKYDVSFQGWNYSPTRQMATRSCSGRTDLILDFALYPDFCGYIWDKPEGLRRRAEFRRSMHESRIMLCPESIPGVFPYRFFEAMSAGRVPLLISSNYVLPQEQHIPYKDFCCFLPRNCADDAGQALVELLSQNTDGQLIEKGRLGRWYWEKWLDGSKWPSLMATAVVEKMKCLTAA